jgi:methylated-DNA-[protein]-cysteine S-methyltransferase
LDAVSVTRVVYTAEGWGEGELWFAGPTLLWHELPQRRRTAPEKRFLERAATRPPPTARGRAERRRRPHPHPGGETSRRPSRSTIPADAARVRDDSAPEARRLVGEVQTYFRGEPTAFDRVRLELGDLTAFQREIVAALRSIPWGEVVSYRELARSAGYPNAQRAAGTLCAHNRFPLVLPCHRVVSSSGIGGYGSLGPEYKRRLLELEGVSL